VSLFLDYLGALAELRGVGVPETSGYGALQNLINGVSASQKLNVRCILHPGGGGGNIPDGALFSREQLSPLGRDFEPAAAFKAVAMPARGVVEVKGLAHSLDELLASAQAAKYLARYRKLVATNYREFAVVEMQDNVAHILERFELAPSVDEFWARAGNAGAFEVSHGARLEAFLARAILRGAPLASPEALAAFMASCAREAKARVEAGAHLPALESVRTALERALDIQFTEARAGAFFRSSLVQTLFYGVFSAWVLWCKQNPAESKARFRWSDTRDLLHVPVLRTLFYQLSDPDTLEALDLAEPLDWVSDALNRVDRAVFDERFASGGAVQYFYEPFLAAFDPELRRQLGVWYTPGEVVRYMVARVDTVLREELGIEDGLADPGVLVLDPCCGTGAFLVEVLRLIHERHGASGALAARVAATTRVFGFELLPAPFVVAHLQIGLLLQNLGAPLQAGERAKIFLTNALTGWGSDEEAVNIQLPSLADEKAAADKVKQKGEIVVILGNPPYDGYAGIAMGKERELSTAYNEVEPGSGVPQPEGQGLNELYVRFFRMAERKIVERVVEKDGVRKIVYDGQGIVCFVSNYSWLDGRSHSGMRQKYLSRFSSIWIDNLNGDRFRTGKVAPDGTPDPSIFSTPSNREGIQVGVAIALLARRDGHPSTSPAALHFRALWGVGKRALLDAEATTQIPADYETLLPPPALGLPFMPTQSGADYANWPKLPGLFPTSFPGVQTKRDELVIEIEREHLVDRMTKYFDSTVSDSAMQSICPRAMESNNQFNAVQTRRQLQERGFIESNIVPFIFRPLDARWLYWEDEAGLLGRRSPDFKAQVFAGNVFMEARARLPKLGFDRGLFTSSAADNLGNGFSSYFPLFRRETHKIGLFAGDEAEKAANLSPLASKYLLALGCEPEALFFHALAIQHAPLYRTQNADALRLDWPRLPLPDSAQVLAASQVLGSRVAALLDVLSPVAGVTGLSPAPHLRAVAALRRTDGSSLEAADFELRANWGFRSSGAVMAGAGRAIERDWTPEELTLFDTHEGGRAQVLAAWGESAWDVFLNERALWSGVPSRAWSYTLGGYRVLKKWLSYREHALLGRALSPGEAQEAAHIARRIASLLLLETTLDTNFAACASSVWSE
jgi:hypothetical protein